MLTKEEMLRMGADLLCASDQTILAGLIAKGDTIQADRLLAERIDGLYEAGELGDEEARRCYERLGFGLAA